MARHAPPKGCKEAVRNAAPARLTSRRRISLWVVLLLLLQARDALCEPAAPPSAAPPGFNVHFVRTADTHVLWRGGAPTAQTLKALARSARTRGVTVTLIDLRTPPTTDDQSGKGGRLSPTDEEVAARAAGMTWIHLSALDAGLIAHIDEALKRGDVFVHCMYGVNRTGFAMGRYATANGLPIDRTGMGERDWRQGVDFQNRRRP